MKRRGEISQPKTKARKKKKKRIGHWSVLSLLRATKQDGRNKFKYINKHN